MTEAKKFEVEVGGIYKFKGAGWQVVLSLPAAVGGLQQAELAKVNIDGDMRIRLLESGKLHMYYGTAFADVRSALSRFFPSASVVKENGEIWCTGIEMLRPEKVSARQLRRHAAKMLRHQETQA